jgi:hypothetical protein
VRALAYGRWCSTTRLVSDRVHLEETPCPRASLLSSRIAIDRRADAWLLEVVRFEDGRGPPPTRRRAREKHPFGECRSTSLVLAGCVSGRLASERRPSRPLRGAWREFGFAASAEPLLLGAHRERRASGRTLSVAAPSQAGHPHARRPGCRIDVGRARQQGQTPRPRAGCVAGCSASWYSVNRSRRPDRRPVNTAFRTRRSRTSMCLRAVCSRPSRATGINGEINRQAAGMLQIVGPDGRDRDQSWGLAKSLWPRGPTRRSRLASNP